jgi:coproporphyrinogen III oxidase-like Fe-S oxidoreductase
MAAGWPFARFRQTTGFDLMETWGREIDGLIAQGWGRRDAASFRLTDEGMRFADAAAEQFIG